MKYHEALDKYIEQLYQNNYLKIEISRKKSFLKKWPPYVISLFHPGVQTVLLNNTDMLDIHKKACPDIEDEEIKEIEEFINNLRIKSEKLVYLNLFSFLQYNRRKFPCNGSEKKNKFNAISKFCSSAGMSIRMSTITEKLFQQVLSYLDSISVKQASSHTRNFFIFCFEQNIISFNPHITKKSHYARVFEPDFISAQSGFWCDHLKDYIHYLQFEKNFSDGGIYFQASKLKLFTEWLGSHGIKKVNTDIIQRFLAKKQEDGIKDSTMAMHLKTIKYFLNFMVEKNLMKNNPAIPIRIKNRTYYEADTLTESEINQVIEYLEKEIYKTKNSKERKMMMSHFLAVRDLCLFQVFVFTGLRLSEASNIKLCDIDLEKKSIRIAGKGNKEHRKKIRDIFLNDYLWTTLRQYLKLRGYPGQEYLWISFRGSPTTNSGIRKIIPARIKQAGIDKKISVHRLRATCASLYVKNGMDPLSLKTVMGHSKIATTIDHYAKLTEEELRSIWKETNPLAGIDDE